MIEFSKQQNELKHASLACREFVLEAEEQAVEVLNVITVLNVIKS